MSRRFAPLALLAAALIGPAAPSAKGQAPAPPPTYQVVPYVYQYQPAPGVCPQCGRVHAPGAGRGERPWLRGQNGANANSNPNINFNGNVNPYLGPYRLPRGQVYYNGRYFGSFNNRFYGPQYGYF